MSGSTVRVLQLLELLQAAGTRSLGELAERLEVDERTVRRYVGHLRDLEIPVETIRGRYGGYQIAAGLRMPPLMLSDDEAVAVMLGLLHAQSAPGVSTAAMQTAMSKVQRSLPVESARQVEILVQTAAFSRERGAVVPDAGVLLTVADAVHQRNPLLLRYRARGGEPSKRTVHPYDLVVSSGRWYIVAFDVTRRAERTFRLDRVMTARALSETFDSPPPRDRDAVTRLNEGFARADYAWQIVLRVQASTEHIRAHLPTTVARIERLSDAVAQGELPWHRVAINAERLEWLPPLIAALECAVVVEQPAELRALIADVAERLQATATSA